MMGQPTDVVEAERIMRAAGCIPLVPYPGSSVPWQCMHGPCGEEIAPLFSNVQKRGTACRKCGAVARGVTRRAGLAASAVATMRAAGFEPLVPYPGSDRPWRSLHESCGEIRTPTLNSIRQHGTACRLCSAVEAGRRVWTPESAEAEFRLRGLEPLQPWPGSSSKPWPARHTECGRVVAPRLGNIAAGQGPCRECGQDATHSALRLDEEVAVTLMRSMGLEPIAPFPGVDAPWKCRHLPCGRTVSPTYTNTKRGQGGCVRCAAEAAATRLRMPETEAALILNRNELTPLEPYRGSGRPWKSRHECDRVVTPTLANVSAGRGICRYCNSAFPYDGPAVLYLVVDHNAIKIGCADRSGRRIAEHEAFGWMLAWVVDTPTGDDAYNLEQAVLSWWRGELGLPHAYPKELLPQTGYTETAEWEDMHPLYVLAKVDQLADELGLPPLQLHPTRYAEERPGATATSVGPRARRRDLGPMQEPLEIGLTPVTQHRATALLRKRQPTDGRQSPQLQDALWEGIGDGSHN